MSGGESPGTVGNSPGPARRTVQKWFRRGVRLVALFLAVVVTFVLASAFFARKLPDLQAWHRKAPEGEFRARDLDEDFGLAEYLALEEELMKQLPRYQIPDDQRERFVRSSRFLHGGPGDPSTFEHNWNRTTELVPPEVRGGVLLLHGCSDSPYSLRAEAEIFHARGFYTLSMRLPGHGTVPAGLKQAEWRDWEAAAQLGARHVAGRLGADQPFFVCGYSVGGALSIRLALDAIEDGETRMPDQLLLFSPCIGVTAFGRLAMVDQSLAWIPYFEKSAWLNVSPEYDPYKYISFAEQAGYETWDLTTNTAERWDRVVESGAAEEFPPVLCFQSAVDSTILTGPILAFMEALPDNGSELVVFDVDHASRLEGYFHAGADLLTRGIDGPAQRFARTVITNASSSTHRVMARHRPAGSTEITEEPLELSWPEDMISLGHVAIPFSPRDPNYGEASASKVDGRLTIGSIVARGEWGALKVSSNELMRVRHNPFFDYLQRRLEETIPWP